ncbi:MAG: bifunctional (p)ppGpp synthetase/guanosine-3',5'-bis(diphosphate) 3'-pyrophosphohydrolase [bacterium]|nr:bifunctional (p)ppGpp synthetase/guanosine-3',5'-bis(diphosphate) 3'-pyrophosphohydrolase [bacterium]
MAIGIESTALKHPEGLVGLAADGSLWVHGRQWESEKAYIEDNLSRITAHLDDEDCELVRRACYYAADKHRGQKRLSGDEYVVHLVEVAAILAQYKLDGFTLAVAFLHDLIEEHTGVDIAEVREKFGASIARMVDGVTRLTGLFSRQERIVSRKTVGGRSASASKANKKDKKGDTGAAETLRKIFVAIARDLRVVLVKVADRLHNLRTLDYCEQEVRQHIALETLNIFSPIVSRLGIWEFKAELEDTALKYAYPEEYARLVKDVEANRQNRQAIMMQCVGIIKEKLKAAGIEAQLEQRSKHLYSIYRKLVTQGKELDEIYDLQAIRIIVPTVEDCYAAFGMVHALWRPMNDRIKDYIARPKANNYRSLHTTVYGPQDQLIEVQIRTFEMHRFNECGVAAHFAYKEGRKAFSKGSSDNFFREFYPWIRALFDWQSDTPEDKDFNEHLQVDVLAKDIFVFTPAGDVVDLPVGATPLDFAYMVHTEVGHRCIGALVNGKIVPLGYKLQNADVVTIQTAKVSNPSRDWLRICTTHQAQAKIRSWFKRERREENIARGREMLRKEAAHNHREEVGSDEELLTKAAELLKYPSADDVLAAVGYGEISIASLWGRMLSLLPEKPEPAELPATVPAAPKKGNSGRDVYIEGLDNILTKMAHCCNPAPGDDIVGYISMGKGLSVHRSSCRTLARLRTEHPERVVKAHWTGTQSKNTQYLVTLTVLAHDRSNLVGDVLSVLNEVRANARSCAAWSEDSIATVNLSVEVADTKQIAEIAAKLRRVKSVTSVVRR